MLDFEHARQQMVDRQLVARGIRDEAVLSAMQTVPRERFVAPGMEEFAYEDGPLAIGEGQTISQPYVVAYMIELAQISAGERVLEVGAGSGYAAAIISRIAGQVIAIERHAVLAQKAGQSLSALGYDNVEIVAGDGSRGYRQEAPFDAIIVSAGGSAVPMALKEQLALGGRLVMPVGRGGAIQRLLRLTKTAADRFDEDDFGGVMFVPLVAG